MSEQSNEDLTEYVITRFYRAPEVMLSSHDYSQAVDIWSAGCSFAEAMCGKILFPGEHYIDQINIIMNLRGTPDQETMVTITNEQALTYV